MANIKVQQKLGQAAFAVLAAQIKSPGVHVINEVKAGTAVTSDDVIGKVQNAFNLGGKIDVTLSAVVRGNGSYRFEKIQDVYYLVRK